MPQVYIRIPSAAPPGTRQHTSPLDRPVTPPAAVSEMEQSLLAGAADSADEIEELGPRRGTRGELCTGNEQVADSLSNSWRAARDSNRQGTDAGSSSNVQVAGVGVEDDTWWLPMAWQLRRWLPQTASVTVLAWPIVLPSIAATPLLAAALVLFCLNMSQQEPWVAGAPSASSLASSIIIGMDCSSVRVAEHVCKGLLRHDVGSCYRSGRPIITHSPRAAGIRDRRPGLARL